MIAWRAALAALALASQAAEAQTIAFISDLNGRYGGIDYDDRIGVAVAQIVRDQPDLVACTGDMVAGQKQPDLDADWLDRMWASFNRAVADPLYRGGIPLLVTPGNHDASAYPRFELERERFEVHWRRHFPELVMLPGSEWPRRYAARMGDLLLIGFDGTRPGPLPDEELQFLESMLKRHGSDAEATVVFSHLPMWPLTQSREREIIPDPKLLALLHEQGVDVYASGHHHAFFAGIDEAGMVHLAVGALGGNARAFSGQAERQPFSYAVLELSDGSMSIRSRAAPTFTSSIPATALPAVVNGPLGRLERLDHPAPLRP